jgi:hypothetical protein
MPSDLHLPKWARRESNPHAARPQGLSPLCLPFHHAPISAVSHAAHPADLLG